MLTNRNNRVLYIGVTNDLVKRLYQHKTKQIEGFTQKYNVNKLVYFEETTDVYSALTREKELKGWKRARKNALIEAVNPEWRELKIN